MTGPHPDATQFLAAYSPFAGLEAGALKMIASRCRPRSRRSGESLFQEGDPCHDLYIPPLEGLSPRSRVVTRVNTFLTPPARPWHPESDG